MEGYITQTGDSIYHSLKERLTQKTDRLIDLALDADDDELVGLATEAAQIRDIIEEIESKEKAAGAATSGGKKGTD
jgi:hypothetical protein